MESLADNRKTGAGWSNILFPRIQNNGRREQLLRAIL
jgi:hypothetical protein